MHVHLGSRDVHIAAEQQPSAVCRQPRGPIDQTLHESELGGVVLAAVGNVDRRDHEIAVLHLHDARLHVEGWMAEDGIDREQILPDVQGHARIPLQGVPVGVVALDFGFGGDLRGRCLQLLEAHHIRPVTRQPLGQLGRPGADAVHVPGGDFHARNDKPLTTTRGIIYYQSVMKHRVMRSTRPSRPWPIPPAGRSWPGWRTAKRRSASSRRPSP